MKPCCVCPWWAILALSLLVGGCVSYEEIVEKRHQRLLEVYPPGETTRDQVVARWNQATPELSRIRPAAGWGEMKEPFLIQRVEAVEHRTKQIVQRFDRYFGADGLFSLCRCWFYFDAEDRLIDAEWEYVSD